MLRVATAVCSIAFSSNLFACLGPAFEDYVLLSALPTTAREQDVVAKVRVIFRKDEGATVVVVEAIKGVVLNERIELKTSGSSCSWLEARSRFFNRGQGAAAGKATQPGLHYIAGSWLPKPHEGGTKTFTGAWRGETRMH